MRHIILAEGSKSGKGSSSYRTPVEAKNTLRAIQYASIVDVISEGPIVGLSNSDKGIYLNETPLRTSGGTLTMQDVTWDIRYGLPEQASLPYEQAASAETGVGAEVTKLYPRAQGPDSGKYQFSVNNQLSTQLRITLAVQALYETLTNQSNAGDIIPASVSYRIYVYNNNNVKIFDTSRKLEGKTMSQYLWAILITLDGNGPWLATVEKTSADSNKTALSNDLYISSYTEIIGYGFSYPNTAMLSISASAESFSNSIPTRVYLVKGLKVNVPSNYNPETRVYSGIWDGTFKSAWTCNPAWVFYDLVTNERYGAACYLPWAYTSAQELCDKWLLYEIAQLCDELVPDGFGGYEPRYTFNYQIMGAEDAAQVLQSVASTFHGMSFWSSGLVYAKSDYPTDPIRTINQTNVLEGKITYSTGSIQERHSVVLVTWNDPDDMYKAAIEAVYDWDLVEKFGYNPVSTVAYGCTSRGQAHRHGLWVLATEAEDIVVTVQMGLDSFDYLPGDVVRIADPAYMGYRTGGRIKAINGTEVILDAEFEAVSGETYTLVINAADGTEESRKVTNISGNMVRVSKPYSKEIDSLAVWSMLGTQTAPGQYAIQKMSEKSKAVIEIQLKEVNPNKYAEIEQGLTLERLPTQRDSRGAPEVPTELNVFETVAVENGTLINKVLFSWKSSDGSDFGSAVNYRVQTKDSYGNIMIYAWQETASIDISGLVTGIWTFSVMGRGANGLTSAWADIEVPILGIAAPSDVTGLRAIQDGDTVDLMWGANKDVNFSHYEVREGWTWDIATVIAARVVENSLEVPVHFKREYGFLVKAINNLGDYSKSAAFVQVSIHDLPDANVFISWSDFTENNYITWDEIRTPWEDYMRGLTWLSARTSGTLDKTRFIDNPLTLMSIEDTWENQPEWTWEDYGGARVLTLEEEELYGTWTSDIKDIGKVLSADIYQDVSYIATSGASVSVEVRTSLDNEVWDDWAPFIAHSTVLRYIQYRLVLTAPDVSNQPIVMRIYVVVDMPDIIRSGRSMVEIGGGIIAYGYEYTVQPSVVITADGAERQAQIIGEPGLSEVTVKVVSAENEDVGGVVNWTARGY